MSDGNNYESDSLLELQISKQKENIVDRDEEKKSEVPATEGFDNKTDEERESYKEHSVTESASIPPVRSSWFKSYFGRSDLSGDQKNVGVNRLLCGWEHVSSDGNGLEKVQADLESGRCKLDDVGVFGETLLHWALLNRDRPVAEFLIDNNNIENFQHLRTAVYYGKEYNLSGAKTIPLYAGEGCLHLAIANRDIEMVFKLLNSYELKELPLTYFSNEWPRDRGYPLNSQRAIGDFFRETGDNSVYYGETALDFAVSTNQIKMVDLLLGYPTEGGCETDDISIEKLKFNGKWRASLKLKDNFHQNTVYHLCALRGYTKLWNRLIDHMMVSIAAEAEIDDGVEVELWVERWVRSQINDYGLTPLQMAVLKNNKKMVECIMKQTRLPIWKWGEEAFYGYPLNEIDEYFKNPRETPGIPVNSIILSEGLYEMLELPLIVKLMKTKWSKFGKKGVIFFSVAQFFFCIVLTGLFIECYPRLDDLEQPWGKRAIDTLFQKGLWLVVFIKAVYEIVTMSVEMMTLWEANIYLQHEILLQKLYSKRQQLRIVSSYTEDHEQFQYSNLGLTRARSSKRDLTVTVETEVDRKLHKETRCQRVQRVYKSFKAMMCIYFEQDLSKVPVEFQDQKSRKRAHTSVVRFFITLSWLSNVGFIVAQVMALMETQSAARGLLIMMILILICEYVQLFLWFQTYDQVGRFISSVVNILYKDVFGFGVVFLIILLSFTACFLLLGEAAEVNYKWLTVFYIIYELSVGTGEWFKDTVDDMTSEDLDMDNFRKALLFIVYMIYITAVLVILMNLLIAVMSETAISLAKHMKTRELSLKLSSVSLVSRRVRAAVDVAQFFCRCIFSDKCNDYCIGGQSGVDMKILEGRLNINEDVARKIKESIYAEIPAVSEQSITRASSETGSEITLENYYNRMHYWTILEHEAMDIDKDGKKKSDNRKLSAKQVLDKMIQLYQEVYGNTQTIA